MIILIIGIGSIAQKHIKSVKKFFQESTILALRSSYESKKFGEVEDIYDLNEIKFKIDFVIISNPTYLHEKTILECIKLGCPLFIEKPVLSELTNANFLSKAIKDSNTKTYVACNLRFHPAVIFLKQYISKLEDKINEVNVYFGSYMPSWRPGKDYKEVYSSYKSLGGGVRLDLIHEIDYCVWLFGMPNKVYSLKRKISNLEIDSEDFISYNLVYEKFTVNIILNYYRIDNKRTIELVCESDTLVTNLIENSIYSTVSNSLIYSELFEMSNTYDDQIQYFVNSLESKNDFMNNFDESIEILKLALNE